MKQDGTEYLLAPPQSRATALRYDGQGAPTVTATGNGAVADAIVRAARRHNVPVCEDPALAGLLGQLKLGDEIPTALYTAVAEVIAFAYMLSGKVPESVDRGKDPKR